MDLDPLQFDEEDFCRGFGANDTNTNLHQYTENYFENDEEDQVGVSVEDPVPPSMGQEFYNRLDSFLNIPPPKIHGEILKKKKPKAGELSNIDTGSGAVAIKSKKPKESVLPKISSGFPNPHPNPNPNPNSNPNPTFYLYIPFDNI